MFTSFLNGLKSAFGINTTSTVQTNTSNPVIKTNVFENMDKTTFLKTLESNQGQNNIFGLMANSQNADVMFDYFDQNKDGKISNEEAKAIANLALNDGNADEITTGDLALLELVIASDEQAAYEANQAAIDAANQAAKSAYAQNIGGDNYQNYGSRMRNGSTISSQEQFNTKNKLENIENKEIPELENKKNEVINNAEKAIAEQNTKLEKFTKEHEAKLGQLGKDYEQKEKEIQECDKKITDLNKNITDAKTSLHKANSTITNLEAELSTLSTNTGDEKIDTANKARKAEIETILRQEKQNITNLKKSIEEYEQQIKEQETLKQQKTEEQAEIQKQIDEKNPELGKIVAEIKNSINEINKTKNDKLAELNKQIEAKRSEALGYQKEIGERTGKASSMSGSKIVQEALKIAAGEIGVREIGRNGGADVAKYRNGANNGAAWCASFVSYIYGRGQGSDNAATFGYDASVLGIMNKAARAGYYSQKGSYTPKPGDIMIQRNGCSHTGIVEAVDSDGTIHTIEGNTGNAVRRRTYRPGSRGYNKISGWVRMTEWQSASK